MGLSYLAFHEFIFQGDEKEGRRSHLKSASSILGSKSTHSCSETMLKDTHDLVVFLLIDTEVEPVGVIGRNVAKVHSV